MHKIARRLTIAAATAALVAAGAPAVASPAVAAQVGHVVQLHRTNTQKPVKGSHAGRASAPRVRMPQAYRPRPVAAPEATTATIIPPRSGAWTPVGASGLAIGTATGPAAAIRADVLSPAEAGRFGLRGLTIRLTRTTPSPRSSSVALSVPTALMSRVYGAGFSAAARWYALTGCSSTRCSTGHPLVSRRVTATSAATPTVPATKVSTAETTLTPAGSGAMVATVPMTSTTMLVTAATAANASDGSGNFAATSLGSSSQWTVSPQTGDFTWSYPLRTPPPAAGPTPNLSLSYDSNSINGETGSTNNQPSQVGEGFDLAAGGYVERAYVPCSQAGISNSGDECWKTDNATLMLDGQSSQLVKSSSGSWRLADDDNTKVEHLTSNSTYCSNGTYDSDCWRLTTSDGTQYYFGRNHLPGWTSGKTTTNSTWTLPVCGTATTACSGKATTATPFNTQAWRWNLDYVVDVYGNSEAFYYTTETNKYAEKASTTASVSYVRGGYLARVDYGMHAGYELSKPAPEQVVLTPAARCETGVSGEPSGACTTMPPSTSNAQYWPDVPWNDYYCSTTACSGKTSPTFWSAKRLSTITTRYLSGSSYIPVDTWSLAPAWPIPGDSTTASLTLASITHTGKIGGTTTLPATSFSYAEKPNRVAPPNGIVPLNKPRLIGITTETGAHVTINYLDTDCAAGSLPTPQTNTKRCFPQYWAPDGSTPTLDWFRIYPVASVIADPVTGGSLDHPDQTFYDYSIGTPAYRLDTSPLTKDGYRTWSVFAGYSKVRVEHGDPNTPATLQTTDYTYLQGMDGDISDPAGDKRSVTVTASDGTAVKDSLWWAGATLETQVYDGLGGSRISDTVNTPWASAATNTGTAQTEKIGTSSTTFSYTPTSRHTGQLSSVTYQPLSTGGTRTTKTDNSFDSYGRVTKAEDLGDTSTSGDDRCTITTYADNTSRNLLDLPDETNTYAGTCAALPSDPATATISDSRIDYDSLAWGASPTVGNPTTLQQASAFTGTTPTWTTTATNTYDLIGRMRTSKDALNRVTSTAYTPAAPDSGGSFTGDIGPLTRTVATDPKTFTRTDNINPAWGSTTSSTDVNGNVTTTTYDPLGRISGEWDPNRPQASNPTPTASYVYTIAAGQPVAVASTTLTPAGGTQTSYTLYDGLLRPRQTQAPAEAATYNATPGSGGSSVTETLYDFAGQPTDTYGPYPITAAPSASLYAPAAYSNIASSTTTDRDGAGRVTATVTDAYGAEQWRTSSAYPGVDRVDVTPPHGGTPTTAYTDARGRTTALLQWHGTSVGDTTDTTSFDKTSYTYYPTGQQQSLTNQAGEQWSWTYDTLGRVITATDPDTGVTHTSYDADNEVQSTTDANGITLWNSYDADGRKTAINQTSASGPLLDAWSYDTVTGAKGLLASSTSYVGATTADGSDGTPYTETVTGYDADGHPTGGSVILPAGTLGTGSAAYTYTTSASYNPDGSVAKQVDPAAGGLRAETINDTYTSLGRLYSVIGIAQYLTATAYDPATGLVTAQDRYNGLYRLRDAYTYTPGTLRLATVQTTTAASSNNLVANITYTYTDSGNITAISNTPSGGAATADTQCFNYDYLQRLTQAWTPSSGDCTAAPSSSSLSGPAPYWQAYTYASDGNRTSVDTHATGAGGTDELDTYTYPTGVNPVRPHGLTTVAHVTAPSGTDPTNTSAWSNTAADNYGYNGDGQTTTAGNAALSWTPQGQLQQITIGTQTENRVYDANGNLLVQTDPVNGATAYLGDTELHVPAGSTTATGQRIYTAGGTAIATRTGTTINWLDTDPHGTNTIAENFSTGTATTRYYDPFGNPRATSTPSWPTDRGFLNAPTDPFSSFSTLGAREYEPALGRFLSVDPQLNASDPQSINGYAYANNDPVNGTDPTGLCYQDSDGVWVGQGCTGSEPGNDGVGSNYLGTPSNGSTTITGHPSWNSGGGSNGGGGSSSGSSTHNSLPTIPLSRLKVLRADIQMYMHDSPHDWNVPGTYAYNALMVRIRWAIYGPVSLSDLIKAASGPIVSTVVGAVGLALCPESAGTGCAVAVGALAGAAGACAEDCSNREAIVLSALAGAITGRVASEPETDVGVGASSGSAPVLKGQEGVELSVLAAQARGETVVGREITMDTSAGRTRPDLLVRDANGNLKFIESKNGPTSRLTPNQSAAFPVLRGVGGIPRGANAAAAGLTPGTPIGPIPVQVDYWP